MSYLYLPDAPSAASPQAYTSNSIAWTPLASGFDVRMKLQLIHWTSGGLQRLIGNRSDGSALGTFSLEQNNGLLNVYYRRSDGSLNVVLAPTSYADGTTKWIRVTFNVNVQPMGQDVWTVYDSSDGVNWQQVSTEQLTTAASLNTQANPLSVGNEAKTFNDSLQGKVYYADVRDPNGVILASFDGDKIPLRSTTWTDAQGNTWALQGNSKIDIQKCPNWRRNTRPYRRISGYNFRT